MREGNGAGGSMRYFHDLSEIPCQPRREEKKQPLSLKVSPQRKIKNPSEELKPSSALSNVS